LRACGQNPEADLRAGKVLCLLQRALVLLGNTSNGIYIERCKIAELIPSLKVIATEEFSNRK